jgi:hypothetical protein
MRRTAAAVAAAVLMSLVVAAGPSRAVSLGPCAWAVKADPDRVNVAFPDEGAQYWFTQVPLAPGGEVLIRGRFPKGRYMSFHAYEGSVPIDIVTDHEIVPATGVNPFVVGARRDKAGTYQVRVVGGPRPPAAERAPNTLYAGEGLNGEQVPTAGIIYRIYLPEGDLRGGVPLPEVRYRTGAADTFTAPLPNCDDARPPADGSLNEAVKSTDWPFSSPGMAAQPPSWGLARSRPARHDVLPVNTGNPFFANFDNEYLSLSVGRNAGDVVAFRAKAPTFADTRGAKRMPTGELRYWSFCTNEFATTRYVACLAD